MKGTRKDVSKGKVREGRGKGRLIKRREGGNRERSREVKGRTEGKEEGGECREEKGQRGCFDSVYV